MLLKQKSLSLTRNLALATFSELLIVLSTKVNLLYLIYATDWRCTSSPASDKANLFAKNFYRNSNLDDSGISLPVFPSRTNLKLHNISITPTMIEKIMNLDSCRVSGELVPLPYSWGRSTRYSYKLQDFSVTMYRCCNNVYVNSFSPCTVRPWNSLNIECFPLTYDHSGFNSRINRHLLAVGSFKTDFLYSSTFMFFLFLQLYAS